MEPNNEAAPNEDGFQIVSPERFLEMKLQAAAARKFQAETEFALADPDRAAALRDAVTEPPGEEPVAYTPLDQLRREFEEEHGEPVEPPPAEGEEMFRELLEHLEAEMPDVGQLLGGLFQAAQRDEKAHAAQMELVGDRLRAAMAEANLEQNESGSPEAETLEWGIWRSTCGCLHLGAPDGRGGWAKSFAEVEPEKLEEVVRDMAQSLAQVAMTLIAALMEGPPEEASETP